MTILILLHLRSLKELLVFHDLRVTFWNITRIYIFFFSYKILIAIVTLFFSNYFQSSFSDGKFITFHLDLFIIDLYLSINFCYSFSMSSCFCMTCNILNTFIIFFVDGIYCCFFVFYPLRRIYILFSTVRIYFMTSMIQQINTIKKKTHYLLLISNYFDIYFWINQKVLL